MVNNTMELAPIGSLAPPSSEVAEAAGVALDQSRLAALGSWAVDLGNRAVDFGNRAADKITDILPDRLKTQTAIMLGAGAFGGAVAAEAVATTPAASARTLEKSSSSRTLLKFNAFNGSTKPSYSVTKPSINQPIYARYRVQDSFYQGVYTPVEASLKYVSKTKYKPAGVSLKKSPSFSKIYGNRAYKAKVVLNKQYTTGIFSQDRQQTKELDQYDPSVTVKLKPNKVKKVKFLARLDKCIPWPVASTPEQQQDLKDMTGFSSQPEGYTCTPAKVSIHYEAKGLQKRRYSVIDMSGGINLENVKIIAPAQTVEEAPTQPTAE
ncbi:MAG: hypothetical protein AAB462_00290 [Patescibacteria group bacterium]